jgi:hypothetical protein
MNKIVICKLSLKSKQVLSPCIICDIRHKPNLAYVIPIGGELGWWAQFNQLEEYQNGEWEQEASKA